MNNMELNDLKKNLKLLVNVIDNLNDAAEDEDKGRPNRMLCLIIYDDGSGRIGTSTNLENINTHLSFANIDELGEFISGWCDE